MPDQMDSGPIKALHYKRSHFATQLPVEYLYTASHAWIAPLGEGLWRIGLTKFATRMLGEMVDHGFEAQEGAKVGLLDADIYGPSIPIMLGLRDERPKMTDVNGKGMIIPIELLVNI